VHVKALDNEGNPAYPEIIANYNEFTVTGNTFGTKKLLPLPNNSATKFNVYSTQASDFQSDSNGRHENEFFEWEKQTYLSMWGAKWYHAVFAINAIMLLLMAIGAGLSPVWMVRGNIGLGDTPFTLVPRLQTPWLNNLFAMHLAGAMGDLFPTLLPILLFCGLLISAWLKIGTPKLIKHTAIMAIFIPVGYTIYDIVVMSWIWIRFEIRWRDNTSYFIWILNSGTHIVSVTLFFLVSVAPFLCIYFNVRRYDKTLSLTRSLMSWLPYGDR